MNPKNVKLNFFLLLLDLSFKKQIMIKFLTLSMSAPHLSILWVNWP